MGKIIYIYCFSQELVRKELNEVFGDSDRPCTIEDAAKLKYMECCLKESLRLFPSVPNIKRYINEDIVLNGYKIPAGATISMHIFALHRNEEFFPEPLVFKPERFESELSNGRHPFAFVPFSAGPRNCIGKLNDSFLPFSLKSHNCFVFAYLFLHLIAGVGQRFALFEEKVLMSSLLRRFRFTYNTAKHGPAKPSADLVLKPHHGMPMIVTALVP